MKKLELPKPENQIQEVLYELIMRFSIDRPTMMLSCGVMNLTSVISRLREKGVKIDNEEITGNNKYGREYRYVRYKLQDKKDAILSYENMQLNN